MADLAILVDKMYRMLAHNLSTKQAKAEAENDDIISQLELIESRLWHYVEVRDYLTHGLRPNDYAGGRIDPQLLPEHKMATAIGVFELEKNIEKAKK